MAVMRETCGSQAGLFAHAFAGEPACVVCLAFEAAELLELERRRRPVVPRPRASVAELIDAVEPSRARLRLVSPLDPAKEIA